MLCRLLNTLAFNFYKTKNIGTLGRKNQMKAQQKNFKNWTIVRGDFVKILTGDDKGKKGKVVKVLRKLNRVVVKNININQISKVVGDRRARVKKSTSIHVSNVGLYDTIAKKAVRVTTAYHPETGEKFRVSKKSGRILYKTKNQKHKRAKRGKSRKIGLKDTPTILAHKVTYQGEDFQAIRKDFVKFIAEKEEREKHLVFAE